MPIPSSVTSLTCCTVVLVCSPPRPLFIEAEAGTPEPIEEQAASSEDGENEDDELEETAEDIAMVPTPKTTQSLAELFKSFEDAIDGKDLSPEWIEQRGQIVHAISEAMKTHRPSRAADFENYRTFARMLILISTFISHGKAKDYLAGMEGIKIADQMMIAADSARVPAGSTS